jgi:hypothetical protein
MQTGFPTHKSARGMLIHHGSFLLECYLRWYIPFYFEIDIVQISTLTLRERLPYKRNPDDVLFSKKRGRSSYKHSVSLEGLEANSFHALHISKGHQNFKL